jgi:major membrane immunogen (membrane-anchored lipoprotein)
MVMSKTLVLVAAALALSVASASAQSSMPGYGYAAPAPVYNYSAQPMQQGTTVGEADDFQETGYRQFADVGISNGGRLGR